MKIRPLPDPHVSAYHPHNWGNTWATSETSWHDLEERILASLGIVMGSCPVCGEKVLSCNRMEHFRRHRDDAHAVAEVMES